MGSLKPPRGFSENNSSSFSNHRLPHQLSSWVSILGTKPRQSACAWSEHYSPRPSRSRFEEDESSLKARKWRTLATERVYSTPIFDLHRRRSAIARRGERDFFVIDPTDWVNIIPLTAKREVVMVRQFRHGIGGFTLEIPGGMIDPEDRDPAAADGARCRRNAATIPTTSFRSAGSIRIPRFSPTSATRFSPATLNRCASRIRIPDGSEETEVVTVPLKSVKELIASGKITHALVIAAFSFFDVYNPPPRPLARSHAPRTADLWALASKPYAHLAMAFSGGATAPSCQRCNSSPQTDGEHVSRETIRLTFAFRRYELVKMSIGY